MFIRYFFFLLINCNLLLGNALFELGRQQQIYPTTVAGLVELVKQADLHNQKIAVVGADKSQGGQTIVRSAQQSLRINLAKLNQLLDLDLKHKTVTVQAGMTWSRLQQIIWPHKLAVKAMQSYNDFSIGGSLSVNVHGQDLANNPIIKSVRSLRLLNSAGQIINVSRSENPELFGLVIGGYGLLGIILEVTLDLTDNVSLKRVVKVLKTAEFVDYFNQNIKNKSDIAFYSARFDLNPGKYLEQVIVVTYHQLEEQHVDLAQPESSTVGAKLLNNVARLGMLAVSESNLFKKIRFYCEKIYFKSGVKITRNRFMSFPLDSLPKDNASQMYILQEYFIPYAQVNVFLNKLKALNDQFNINLLNVTARHVNADGESFLSYAPDERCALVLYIKINKAEADYQNIASYATILIDLVSRLGGTYYLPYQLLASKEQLAACYPNIDRFCALKSAYDPKQIFYNQLYEKYA